MLLLGTEEPEWREDWIRLAASCCSWDSQSCKAIKHLVPGCVLLSRDTKSTKSWFLPSWTAPFGGRDRKVSSFGPFTVLSILINRGAEIHFCICTSVWMTFLVICFFIRIAKSQKERL